MRRRLSAVVVALAAVTVSACGGGDDTAPSAAAPSTSTASAGSAEHNAADVMFAQMMIPHHQQAVEMAALAPDRAADPAVRTLAEQIAASQAPEIETMTGWLEAWGEPTTAPSGGAHGGGHDMAAMPGVMSDADMAELEAASGVEFDRMFLEMMVSHHEGAIEMARTEQADGQFPDAVALAETIETTQVAEVETMRELLTA